MTLRLPCQHGKYDDHFPPNEDLPGWEHKYGLMGYERETKGWFWCPGGRQATPEDLIEALGGEKVWMCFSTLMPRCKSDHPDPMGLGGHDSCQFVYLTPALDQEKET